MRSVFLVALFLGAVTVVPTGIELSTAGAAAPDAAPSLIIVSGSARVSGSTLQIASASIDWLQDEPSRSKGDMNAAQLAARWDDYGFEATPPSASITGRDLDVSVLLTEAPRIRSGNTVFTLEATDEELPSGRLGTVSVFIEARAPSLLYVQQATRGTFAPAEGDDAFTLTLQDVSPRAVYFSDRPDRVAGSLGNETLAGLEVLFDPDDPPNAALVISAPASEDEDVVIVQLANPRFDQGANHFTYDATVVDEASEGLHVWDEHRDASVPGDFGHVTLFIDSTVTTCPGQVSWDNGTVNVTVTDADDGRPLEGAQVQLFGTSGPTPDYSGTTDATGNISLSVIPSNALIQDYWRTTVEQPGYVTLQQDVTVCPDQVVEVTADLDPE